MNGIINFFTTPKNILVVRPYAETLKHISTQGKRAASNNCNEICGKSSKLVMDHA